MIRTKENKKPVTILNSKRNLRVGLSKAQ